MPSITGAQDHTPFGSLMAELVYGRRPDGSIVSIADVPSGRKCDCVCPACGVPLIAQKGDVNVHHFRHDGAEAGCGKGGETSAHIWAKLMLEKHLKLLLPEASFRLDGETISVRPARLMTFVNAELEQRDGDIVPDVVVTTKGGHKLIVEIHVTHKCGAAKKAILARQGTAAIEVNLSPLRTCQDQEVVAAFLIGTGQRAAARTWLYSPAIEKAHEAAIIARDKADREKAAADALAAEERRNATRVFVRDLAELPAGEGSDHDLAAVRRHDALDLVEPGDEVLPGFTVATRHWRAAIFNQPVLRQMDVQWGGQHAFTFYEALRAVARYIHPDLLNVSEARKREILEVAPGFVFPRGHVSNFIDRLLAMDILERTYWGDSFQLSPSGVTRLARGKGRIDRMERAAQLVRRIVAAIPAAECRDFDVETWLAAPVAGHEDRLMVLAEAGNRAWLDIEATLTAIEAMQRGGAAVEIDLGLPLAPMIQRIRERETAEAAEAAAAQRRADKAAAERRHLAIYRLADQLLGPGLSRAWLETKAEPGKVTHLVWAGQSDAGYQAVDSRLRAHAAEIEAQRQRDREAADVRRQLETRAMDAWEPAQARWWLDHIEHRLGAIPMVYCVDKATLRQCLAYVPAVKTARRRRG
ncbi:hypothetical protein HRJ34_07955 [Rhizorhabdus wittichii]|uniref:Uncharacterized protein n=1 Tax=Rhizorhabdus wittichii TaxID=160791 RepID=A0A975D5H0_9SPHN|nr:hypothetical protein [Rhizorhabdus wittichii]QTH23422.1 hypothetical protein HRJ34_07955 [Rhizorhabdus wittichii]